MPNNYHITALEELRDWLLDKFESEDSGSPEWCRRHADNLDALLAERAEMMALLQDLRPALSVLRTMLLVGKLRLGVDKANEMMNWITDALGDRKPFDPLSVLRNAAAPQPPKGDGDENSR